MLLGPDLSVIPWRASVVLDPTSHLVDWFPSFSHSID